MALVPTELSLPRLKELPGTVPWAKRLVEELFILLHDMGVAINAMTSGGMVTIRKNTGANVGTRPRLNLVEGSNVTLTVLDDGVGDEVDITIAASGGSSAASWVRPFAIMGG